MTDLLGMPEEKFAVLIGKRGEDRETAVAPLTREQHRHFQRFIAKHMDELVEHMAEAGVDARTIVTPDLYRFATPDDIRLYGSLEQRRSLIARLMADVRADETRQSNTIVGVDPASDAVVVANRDDESGLLHIAYTGPFYPDDTARFLQDGGNG